MSLDYPTFSFVKTKSLNALIRGRTIVLKLTQPFNTIHCVFTIAEETVAVGELMVHRKLSTK